MHCNKQIQFLTITWTKTSILRVGPQQQNHTESLRGRNLEFERTRILPENKRQKPIHIEGNALQQADPVFNNYLDKNFDFESGPATTKSHGVSQRTKPRI